MALDASTLTVAVVSDGIESTTKALNDLATAGENAEKKTSNIGKIDAAQIAVGQFNAMTNSVKNFSGAQDEAAKMAAKIREQMEKIDMLGQIQRWKDAAAAAREEATELRQMQTQANGLNRDVDAFVAVLKRQAETIGMSTKELREYNAEQLRVRAAQLGVSQQTDEYIKKIQGAKGAHESFSLATAGSARELMVLGHELATGNINRFFGSLIVLGERVNFLPAVLERAKTAAASLGISLGVLVAVVGAATAAVGAAVLTWVNSHEELKKLRAEVVLTGGAIGVTGDQLYNMANKIGGATGMYAEAYEAFNKLASTGKFTANQIDLIATTAVNIQRVGGPAIDKTIAQFEKLAADPMHATVRGYTGITDAAMELNRTLNFLEPQVLAEAQHLQNIGEYAKASELLINELAKTEQKRVDDLRSKLTPFGAFMSDLATKIKAAWHDIFHEQSDEDQLTSLQKRITDISSAHGAHVQWSPEETALLNQAAALQAKIAADKKKADDDAATRAKKNSDDEQLTWLNNMYKRAKGQTEADETRTQAEKAFQQLKQDGIKADVLGVEAQKTILEYIEKSRNKKAQKPKSDGLAGVTDAISKIQDEYDIQKNLIDNQIKQVDAANQKKIMSDAAASAAKAKLLDQEDKLALAALEKEMKVREAFYSADKRLMEQNDKAKNDLQKRLTIAHQNAESKGVINAMDDFDPKAQAAADIASQKIVEETVKQTEAIRAKVDAYNSLPEAVRKSVTNEKQMADAVTQALIESKQARIDLLSSGFNEGGQSDKELQRLTSEVNAMRDRVKAEKDLEDVQKRIAGVAGRSSSLTRVATEQSKMWKDTGNEIEKALTNAFGNAGNAAGKMMKAFAENQASQIDLANQIRVVKEKDGLTEQERLKQITALQDQSAQVQVGSYANMADAAAGFFDKQSQGYKIATTVSKAFHLAETAMALASIPAKLAAGAATMFAQSGWGGFAGVAAMTAAVAAFGVAISGGGGGSMSAADQQRIQGTGTVLGSPTITDGTKVILAGAKSESIANSLKDLEKTSGLGLAVQNDMLKAMTNLNNNITALAKNIATNGSVTGFTADTKLTGIASVVANTLGKLPLGLGGLASKIATSIFGGKVTVDDTGLQVNKATLAQIAAKGVSASQYSKITTSGGWFSGDKHDTPLKALDSNTTDQFTKVILSMEDTIKQAGASLGVAGDDFNRRLSSFVVNIGQVSLKGMTSDQIQTTLQNIFSKLGDQMSSYMFSDLVKYQKLGEGLLETVSRVANDLMQFNDVMKVLGRSIPQAAYGIAQAEKLVESFGSSDALSKAVKSYEDAIYTDNEKLAPIVTSVQDSLKSMGLSSVKTKEDFKLVVDSLDLTSDAGVSLFNKLMTLAPTFGNAIDGLAKVNDTTKNSLQSVIDKLKQFSDNIRQFRDGLVLGANSPFTPAQKLADAASQFENTISKAMKGDTTAQGNVTNIAQSYLDAARTMFASGDAYTDVFNKVEAELAKVQGFADAGVSDTQKQLDTMNNQLTSLNTLNGTATDILNSLNNLVSGTSPATTATGNNATNAELLQTLKTLVGTIEQSDQNNVDALSRTAAATYDGHATTTDILKNGLKALATDARNSGALYKKVER